jgi:MoaA/NifB/PqqE/SkfB family radical SAM enzyme
LFFIHNIKIKMKKFDRVNIEIVNTCNLKCSFCPAPAKPAKHMSPGDFARLAASLAPITREVVLHLLGEPLSHPQLDQILDAAAAARLPVNVVTNGMLLSGDRVDMLLRPIVRQVSVSLQSFGNNYPDRDPSPYVAKIKRFTDRAVTERPDLYVNLRFWDLEGAAALGTNHNQELRRVVSEHFGVDWNDVRIDVRRRKSHRVSGRIYLHFDSRFTWPDLTAPKRQTTGRCHGLTGHFGIHADGTVVPCCLDHNGDIPLGNAFSEPLTTILTSSRAEAMRQGFAQGQLVEDLCKTCGYIERFNRGASSRQKGL